MLGAVLVSEPQPDGAFCEGPRRIATGSQVTAVCI